MAEFDPRPGRATGLILIGVVFLLGMLCGAALFYLGQASVGRDGMRPPVRRPEGRVDAEMMRMFRGLDLEPGQVEQIREIMRRSRREIRDRVEESREEIHDLLTDEQRERFDRLRPERRRREGPWPDQGPRGKRPPRPRPPPSGDE